MPSVYDDDNFSGRVNLAALYISTGRKTTRSFDTCFEMYDGDAVATALYRRALADPDGPLSRNLSRYLGLETVTATAMANTHRKNLAAWARELRAEGERSTAAMLAKMQADREARNAPTPYREELTPHGIQLAIPGCERVAAPGKPATAQLSLF